MAKKYTFLLSLVVLGSMNCVSAGFAQSTTGDDKPAAPAASKTVPAEIDKSHPIAPPVSPNKEHKDDEGTIPSSPEHSGRSHENLHEGRGNILP